MTTSPIWSKGTSDSGSISKSDPTTPWSSGLNALHLQHPTPASSSTKVRLSLLATAMVDALGGPPEFHNRFSFPFVDSMIPNQNFNLPAGVWTDDTSMTLCLADSIATYKEIPDSPHTGGFSEIHQLELYSRWKKNGYLSAIGRCFDIGSTTSRALRMFDLNKPEETFDRIRRELSRERFSGNGSLMRVIPVGLAYWRDEPLARSYGKRSSLTTHPNPICVEACEMWTGAITIIMQKTTQASKNAPGSSGNFNFSKLGLLEYISNFPYTDSKLRTALTFPSGAPDRPHGQTEIEIWYHQHHPLLRLIADTQLIPNKTTVTEENQPFPYTIPPVEALPSSGYVLHSLVAALYCFFATNTFEEGALLAVNLGNDADTVGAIYGGLAGCWYAGNEGGAEGVFWTHRVKAWQKALINPDLIEKVADKLVSFEYNLSEKSLSTV